MSFGEDALVFRDGGGPGGLLVLVGLVDGADFVELGSGSLFEGGVGLRARVCELRRPVAPVWAFGGVGGDAGEVEEVDGGAADDFGLLGFEGALEGVEGIGGGVVGGEVEIDGVQETAQAAVGDEGLGEDEFFEFELVDVELVADGGDVGGAGFDGFADVVGGETGCWGVGVGCWLV